MTEVEAARGASRVVGPRDRHRDAGDGNRYLLEGNREVAELHGAVDQYRAAVEGNVAARVPGLQDQRVEPVLEQGGIEGPNRSGGKGGRAFRQHARCGAARFPYGEYPARNILARHRAA